MSIEARIHELGIELDNFVPFPSSVLLRKFLVIDDLVYLSGHLPDRANRAPIRGQLGTDLNVSEGAAAARDVAANLITTLREAANGLDSVTRIVKILGMVNAAASFTEHAAVIDGASSVFAQVWGTDRGVGVRSAVGVSSLPLGAPVEIELVAQLAVRR
jgi:enamine deaminase RidA (YjgF/YER057c/UK114 family)